MEQMNVKIQKEDRARLREARRLAVFAEKIPSEAALVRRFIREGLDRLLGGCPTAEAQP